MSPEIKTDIRGSIGNVKKYMDSLSITMAGICDDDAAKLFCLVDGLIGLVEVGLNEEDGKNG